MRSKGKVSRFAVCYSVPILLFRVWGFGRYVKNCWSHKLANSLHYISLAFPGVEQACGKTTVAYHWMTLPFNCAPLLSLKGKEKLHFLLAWSRPFPSLVEYFQRSHSEVATSPHISMQESSTVFQSLSCALFLSCAALHKLLKFMVEIRQLLSAGLGI